MLKLETRDLKLGAEASLLDTIGLLEPQLIFKSLSFHKIDPSDSFL